MSDNYNEQNTCYTDFASMNSDSYIERALGGNWQVDVDSRSGEEYMIPTNRAVGLSQVYYQPGEKMTIQIRGPQEFKSTVQNTLMTKVFPYVNLKFEFVESGGDCLIDNKWASGGVCMGSGTKNPTLHLSNSHPFLTIHEFGHALGMMHEMRNPKIDLTWIVSALQQKYASGNINIQTQILKPLDIDKVRALPFDKNSVMAYPLSGKYNKEGIDIMPSQEYTDIDKEWLRLTYGDTPYNKSS